MGYNDSLATTKKAIENGSISITASDGIVSIKGNTFSIKDFLKSNISNLRWNKDDKAWTSAIDTMLSGDMSFISDLVPEIVVWNGWKDGKESYSINGEIVVK